TWLSHQVQPPVADNKGGAIPSSIFDLSTYHDVPVETRLAVGPVSVAYLRNDYTDGTVPHVVAVTAEDGRYHVLTLPHLLSDAATSDTPALALSPDGRRLAYSYALPGEGLTARGVAVLDLTTGEVQEVQLAAAVGTVTDRTQFPSVWVRRLTWSPNG